MGFEWSKEANTKLRKDVSQGKSFQQIAADLGCTRNAAIGKAHRMHLAVQPGTRTGDRIVVRKAIALPPRKTRTDEPEPGGEYRCTIVELTDTTCRYPTWKDDSVAHSEKFYCGAPGAELSAGQPYCRYHARLCSNPAQRQ